MRNERRNDERQVLGCPAPRADFETIYGPPPPSSCSSYSSSSSRGLRESPPPPFRTAPTPHRHGHLTTPGDTGASPRRSPPWSASPAGSRPGCRGRACRAPRALRPWCVRATLMIHVWGPGGVCPPSCLSPTFSSCAHRCRPLFFHLPTPSTVIAAAAGHGPQPAGGARPRRPRRAGPALPARHDLPTGKRCRRRWV